MKAYTPEEIESIFCDISDELVEGRPIRKILKDKGMPSPTTFFKWLAESADYSERYAQACNMRADLLFESIEDDYNENPEYTSTAHGDKIDTGWVQLQALKIGAKKWQLEKMAPKVYGNKIDVTSGDKPIEPATPVWNFINANKEQK